MIKSMVSVTEEKSCLYIANSAVKVSFDLKKGTYKARLQEDCQVILEDACAQVDEMKTSDAGLSYTWSEEPVQDEIGDGKMARIHCRRADASEIILGIILYDNESFVALRCGFKNGRDEAVSVKLIKPLAGGAAYRRFGKLADPKLLDGNSGAFETEVLCGYRKLECRNNGMLTFGTEFKTRTMVLGGLRYQDFVKYVNIDLEKENEGALVEMYAQDPHGRRVENNETYFPERDTFYLDFATANPLQAMEKYGQSLRRAQKAEPNAYQFPSVCLWYAEFYDMLGSGKEKLNTSAGAVKEMERIRESGFLKYAPVAVRLVPDYYGAGHQGGNTQQGWWDDEHWQKYQDPDEGNGRYVEPYETSKKWANAVTKLGGIPLTYFQASAVSEDYAKEHPGHMLFNNGKALTGEWLNGAYRADVGYDFTDGEFQEHMRQVYQNLKNAGVKGLMFDYPGTAWDEAGGFEDPYATAANNYVNVFRLAKEGLGKDSFVHERGIETGYDVTLGWVDSQRTEDDTADMPPEMVKKIGLRWYKNRVVTNYDMDSKDLMRAQSRDERNTLVTMAYAVSGRLLIANGFENLDEDTRYALSRTYPQHTEKKSFRPVDAFLGKEYPQVYDYDVNADWHQVIFYNGDRLHDRVIETRFCGDTAFGGLGMDPQASYHVYDFWNNTYVGIFKGTDVLRQNVRKGESRIFSVRRALERPQLLSTSRHIMQGLIDVEEVAWREEDEVLSGISRVVEGEPYRLEIKLPDGKEYEMPQSVAGNEKTDCRIQYHPYENRVTLTLCSRESGPAAWEIRLKSKGGRQGEEAALPQNIKGVLDAGDFGVTLTWEGTEDCEYSIYANSGKACSTEPLFLLGKTKKLSFHDTEIRNGIMRYYQIAAVNRAGKRSLPAAFCYLAEYEKPLNYLETDRNTGGSWQGRYGSDGYSLRGENKTEKLPDYIQEIQSNGNAKQNDADAAACPDLPGKEGKHLGYDSNNGMLSYTVTVRDKEVHQAAFYCADSAFHKFGSIANRRAMSLELRTLSGKVMEEDIAVEQFGEGIYLVFRFRGSFTLTLRNMIYIGVFDAVCSGIFFD